MRISEPLHKIQNAQRTSTSSRTLPKKSCKKDQDRETRKHDEQKFRSSEAPYENSLLRSGGHNFTVLYFCIRTSRFTLLGRMPSLIIDLDIFRHVQLGGSNWSSQHVNPTWGKSAKGGMQFVHEPPVCGRPCSERGFRIIKYIVKCTQYMEEGSPWVLAQHSAHRNYLWPFFSCSATTIIQTAFCLIAVLVQLLMCCSQGHLLPDPICLAALGGSITATIKTTSILCTVQLFVRCYTTIQTTLCLLFYFLILTTSTYYRYKMARYKG